MAKVSTYIKQTSWYEKVRRAFWSNPDRLLALKTTIVIGLLAIPFVIAGKPFYAVTLGLGALAGALSETDDHPKGRIKSMLLKVVSFGIASMGVELLYPYPVLLGIGLSVSTIVLIWIGGISERYRGVTFGALLVGIYAMIGAEITPAPYLQSIMLTAGALFYGLFSLVLLYFRPWRLLEEQLARGFVAVSNYFAEKAKLFPSDEKIQQETRAKLSLLNVQTVNALDSIKDVLNSYGDALKDHTQLKPYLHYFMVLQSLHERAASSHERYEILSNDAQYHNLLEGIGQTLIQLSVATQKFADSLLMQISYKHPSSLSWMIHTMNGQLKQLKDNSTHPLLLLINNLERSNSSLENIYQNEAQSLLPKLAKDTRSLWQRLKEQLNFNNPRLRYGLRLSFAFALGFTISEVFKLAKGEWIVLTILFVLQANYSQTRRRFTQRILGTISGVVIGVLTVQLLTPSGQLMFMLLSAYLFMIWMKRRYAVAVIFITTFVLCAFNLIANKGVAIMTPRIIDTVIGAVVAFISVRFLWPDWQSKRLPALLDSAIQKNTSYFEVILDEYLQPNKSDDLEYRIARREAHRADNELVLAWQNLQLEPRKHQQFRKQAFTLTYLNHALLSYLSAFGAHREKPHEQTEFLEYAKTILVVLQTCTQQENTELQMQKMDQIFKEIKFILKNEGQDSSRQQMVLLYNIAEVTLQLLTESRTFKYIQNTTLSQ